MAGPDYFAELFVAGLFVRANWNVYFPRRDEGIDFIATKIGSDGDLILRPVQVKGKYPQAEKGDHARYGYVGELNQLHPDIVLAIPFFREEGVPEPTPLHVAYLPRCEIKKINKGGFRCEPARFVEGLAKPRRDFLPYFDAAGLARVESSQWRHSARVARRG